MLSTGSNTMEGNDRIRCQGKLRLLRLAFWLCSVVVLLESSRDVISFQVGSGSFRYRRRRPFGMYAATTTTSPNGDDEYTTIINGKDDNDDSTTGAITNSVDDNSLIISITNGDENNNNKKLKPNGGSSSTASSSSSSSDTSYVVPFGDFNTLLNGGTFSGNGYSFPTGSESQSYNSLLDNKKSSNKMKKKKGFRYKVTKLMERHPVLNKIVRAVQSQDEVNDDDDRYDENEDGWSDMRKQRNFIHNQLLSSLIPPIHKTFRTIVPKQPIEPGTLILVRHGESLWNANKTFTGWADPDLSERGFREVLHAARLILEGGYQIDVVFTSRLKRAIRSVWIILQEMDQVYLPVFKSWRLNERMYGALTGYSKKEMAEQLGAELVQEWRSSLKAQPPPVPLSSPHWPGNHRKYADLSIDQIPVTESLSDSMDRTAPLWKNKILYELRNGKNVLVVAHANTLRGLVKTIDDISEDDIREIAIPTGIPIVYKFDQNMKPVPPSGDRQTASQVHMKGLFLEKPGLLKEALKREDEWMKMVPGYNETKVDTPVLTSLERSLFKLQAERELRDWAGQFIDPLQAEEDDGNDGNMGRPMQVITPIDEDEVWGRGIAELQKQRALRDLNDKQSDFIDLNNDDDDDDEPVVANIISSHPCVKSIPTLLSTPTTTSESTSSLSNSETINAYEDSTSVSASTTSDDTNPTDQPPRRSSDGFIVIIRHGKTDHNKLGLFTGWEDAPLAKEGIEEAKAAGRLLKLHGFEFDVVYTSWLSRAIETAWHVIDEMDCLWLPIVKTWRLNERMYGELTGLSKQMVKQRHGDHQFKEWRRGYKTPPPKVSSFSQHYPGNDPRYQKYLNDVRYSVRESLIRSIEQGKLTLHRKLPKSESLSDCMERTIPYFTDRIVPEAIDQGKRVLISSSENAIRGLLMHLCEIPESEITGLEIPNGLPIIFDWKNKCVKLLDDGTGRDPLEVHNFGKAASYLFRPCSNEDGSPDEECNLVFSSDETIISEEDQATIDAIKNRRVVVNA